MGSMLVAWGRLFQQSLNGPVLRVGVSHTESGQDLLAGSCSLGTKRKKTHWNWLNLFNEKHVFC